MLLALVAGQCMVTALMSRSLNYLEMIHIIWSLMSSNFACRRYGHFAIALYAPIGVLVLGMHFLTLIACRIATCSPGSTSCSQHVQFPSCSQHVGKGSIPDIGGCLFLGPARIRRKGMRFTRCLGPADGRYVTI